MRTGVIRSLTLVGFGLGLLTGAPAMATPSAGLAEGLRAALEEAGWQVTRRADGSLELRTQAEVPPQTQAAEEPAAPRGGEPHEEAAWERLTQQGWRVERGADGSALLYPPSPAAQPAAPSEPTGAPEEGPQPQAAEEPAAPRGGEPHEEAAWERLTPQGWRVERGADGSTILYPPSPATQPEAPSEPTGAPEEAPSVEQENAAGLEAQLEARGWRVERADDGSLLLRPRDTPAPTTQKPPPQPCIGELPGAVRGGDVQPPVRSWDQARTIAESWLSEVDSAGTMVGKIREIGGVYLVSIVDRRAPHRLRHQIAIDSDSGRVLVLN